MIAEKVHENAELVYQMVRLRTYPFGVKLIEDESEIPAEALRPLKDLGYHLDLCQAFNMSRVQGKTIAMLKEDMWCFEPVVGFGLAEPPEEFLEGENRFPASIMSKQAARNWARSTLPRLQTGRYKGVLSAPLNTCSFQPDLFVIYCDPEQLTQLLIAQNAIDGRDLDSSLAGHAACVYTVVPVIQKKRPVVAVPCRGDRRNAMAQSNEIIFACPVEGLADLAEALRYLDAHGWSYPWYFELHPERKLTDNYAKLGRLMGMDLK